MPKYIDQLRLYLINKPVDIFGINETRLDDSIDNAVVHIQGYNLYRKDRNRLGGGVSIYARDALNVKNMSQLVPISIEVVCVEVTKPKMKPFLITSIYCPPNSKVDFMDNLENYFNELDKHNSELIISGDLNCELSISDLQPQSRRLHCKFKRVVLTSRGNFRPFCKRVVLTIRKGRFNSEGSFDPIKGSI